MVIKLPLQLSFAVRVRVRCGIKWTILVNGIVKVHLVMVSTNCGFALAPILFHNTVTTFVPCPDVILPAVLGLILQV